MAKRKKKYSASKCSNPLNTMIDLAGAVAMGAYAKHKVKKDYEQGYGEQSIKASMMVYGMGASRRGTAGLLGLGGLYGVNSAIRDIEKSEAAKANQRISAKMSRSVPAYDDRISISPCKTNNNRYAWRMNCEDGSAYGISPQDYETREAYNRALEIAKGGNTEKPSKNDAVDEKPQPTPFLGSSLLCCRVSRLDNGANEYYLTEDETIKVGDTITVTSDAGTTEGVVIGIRRLSEMTETEIPKDNMWILTQEDDEENGGDCND